jgi:ATP-dependent Clp protease adaptor protein ClpS
MSPSGLPELKPERPPLQSAPARVIVYNDDWHTFDEVIGQLMKATACDEAVAELHAWTIHTQGRSMVFQGAREDCERVAGVLREIRLQVEVDWDD